MPCCSETNALLPFCASRRTATFWSRDAKFLALGVMLTISSVLVVGGRITIQASCRSSPISEADEEYVHYGNRTYLLPTRTNATDSAVCSAVLFGGKVCAEVKAQDASTPWWQYAVALVAWLYIQTTLEKVKDHFKNKRDQERALRKQCGVKQFMSSTASTWMFVGIWSLSAALLSALPYLIGPGQWVFSWVFLSLVQQTLPIIIANAAMWHLFDRKSHPEQCEMQVQTMRTQHHLQIEAKALLKHLNKYTELKEALVDSTVRNNSNNREVVQVRQKLNASARQLAPSCM